MKASIFMYNDDYPTCERTYATLRIYHRDLDPEALSARLGIEPTRSFTHSDTAREVYRRKHGAWFLSSEGSVQSRDVRRHVDWILDRLSGKTEVLRTLQDDGYTMDIFCYWVSMGGHGGPMLSPATMQRLAEANLTIGFDVYFHSSGDPKQE